jgi:hypothetical protein
MAIIRCCRPTPNELVTHDGLTDWFKHSRTKDEIQALLHKLGFTDIASSYWGSGRGASALSGADGTVSQAMCRVSLSDTRIASRGDKRFRGLSPHIGWLAALEDCAASELGRLLDRSQPSAAGIGQGTACALAR